MEEFPVADLDARDSTSHLVRPTLMSPPLYSDILETVAAVVECADLDCDFAIARDLLDDADFADEN